MLINAFGETAHRHQESHRPATCNHKNYKFMVKINEILGLMSSTISCFPTGFEGTTGWRESRRGFYAIHFCRNGLNFKREIEVYLLRHMRQFSQHLFNTLYCCALFEVIDFVKANKADQICCGPEPSLPLANSNKPNSKKRSFFLRRKHYRSCVFVISSWVTSFAPA